MARSTSRRKGSRSTRGGWVARLLGAILLAAILGGAWLWWQQRSFRPDETVWPDQGALVGAEDGPVRFDTLAGLGAKFVYLEASKGARAQDTALADNLAAAREAGLQVGMVHAFDPCVPADGQSANFVTVVPRDTDLLPPAIMLDRTAEECPERVTRAAIQSELLTLVNQIEAHAGKPAILAPSEEFEEAYGVAARIDRNLWLTRNRVEPVYGGRPWIMWTANTALGTEAAPEPLRWVVVRP
ncbi:glycoside hydrolase family 25 protein [Qipengyuania sp. MTN3-11]|uniref:glycoside hydrolase family 25 protein n=1 Tax=Qipengyuania sp. MTN3-11 TaxID=3056557 RepID=UPI0036F3D567